MIKESKSDRFIRLADARVNKIIKLIRLLGNCSRKAIMNSQKIRSVRYSRLFMKNCTNHAQNIHSPHVTKKDFHYQVGLMKSLHILIPTCSCLTEIYYGQLQLMMRISLQ